MHIPDDYDPETLGVNLNKDSQQQNQPHPVEPKEADAWTRPAPSAGASQYPTANAAYPPAPPYDPVSQGQLSLSERTSGLALAGFITALASALVSLAFDFASLGFFGSIAAIVLSIIGLVRDVKGKQMKGRGFALAGIIVSAVVLLLIVVVTVAIFAFVIALPDSSS